MLTFQQDADGTLKALRDGEVVATGAEAEALHKGQLLFKEQLTIAQWGTVLDRRPRTILKRGYHYGS